MNNNKQNLINELVADGYSKGKPNYHKDLIDKLRSGDITLDSARKKYNTVRIETAKKSNEYFSGLLGNSYTQKYSEE